MTNQFTDASLLSKHQAAKIMQIGSETLNMRIEKGELGFIKIENRIKIPYKAIMEYIDQHTIKNEDVKRNYDFENIKRDRNNFNDSDFDNTEFLNQIKSEVIDGNSLQKK